MENLIENLKINKDMLDEEYEIFPTVTAELYKRYAEAVEKRDNISIDVKIAKTELKSIEAELFLDILENPEKYGFDKKPTVGAIDSKVLLQKERRNAFDDMIVMERKLATANENVNVLEGIKEGLTDKRKALDGLVTLFVNEYWGQMPKKQINRSEHIVNKHSSRLKRRSE